MNKQLLRVEKVAEILDVKVWRVYDLVRMNLLPAVHMGKHIRIDPDVLEQWINNGGSRLPNDPQSGKQCAQI
jgi:excisionase family DNA binding protein